MHIALDDAGLADAEVPYHQDLIEVLLLVAVLHGERGGRGELSMNPLQRRAPREGEWGRPGQRGGEVRQG